LRKATGIVALCCAWIYTAAHFAASGIRQPLTNFSGDFLASFPSWRLSILLGRQDLFKGSLAEKWARMVDPQLAWTYAAAHFVFSGIKRGLLASLPSWCLNVWQGLLDPFKRSLAELARMVWDPHPLWHYGPVEHLVTLPLFAFSDLRSAYIAWLIVNYAFLIGSLALAFRAFHSGRSKWIWRPAVAIAVLNYGPLYEALTQRNIEIFELLLIFAAFALVLRGRQAASGFAIGLAAMTKFLPLIFLPYFLVKRRFRTLAASMLVIALIAVATEAVFGWRYSGIVVQLRRGGLIESELDQSLAGMVIRLFVWTGSPLSLAMLISRGAIVLALAALSWLFLRARNCIAIEDLEWSTLIVAMVLLPPHNENYYFVLLLFPYLALLARELRPGAPPSRARRWWLVISFILTGTVVPMSALSALTGKNIFSIYLHSGIPFIGAAVLATICVRAVLDECAVSEGPRNDPGMPHAV
jgi:hypothetical protein